MLSVAYITPQDTGDTRCVMLLIEPANGPIIPYNWDINPLREGASLLVKTPSLAESGMLSVALQHSSGPQDKQPRERTRD